MCEDPQEPLSVTSALAMLDRALQALNAADAASLPTAVQADALWALERAEARHTAARAQILAAFTAQDGYEDDGQGNARTWLRWQTRITRGAAAAATAWARRLTAHPVIAQALAAGELSASWAREFCQWSERLPADKRDDADEILVGGARGGADLADLAGLAEDMYQRSHPGDTGDDGFDDRAVWLGVTFGGAGRLDGDLTPGCAAALSAVLDPLAKKAGPEDSRTAAQRRHDALEEACRRLIASGMLPGRAGQPTRAQVHITLAQLRDMPGAPEAEAAWRAAAATEHGWLTGPDADAAACDATLAPIVTGHLDPAALDRLVQAFLAGAAAPETTGRLRGALLGMAADVLSGPGGLASWLRRSQLVDTPGATPSLPLDIPIPLDTGQAEPVIPPNLRRAVATRHRRCAFPGCDQAVSLCQIHHLIPRARGGPTALHNLAPVCAFHHLTVIHHWGWTLTLHPNGTTTATSPQGHTIHSHGPPRQAA